MPNKESENDIIECCSRSVGACREVQHTWGREVSVVRETLRRPHIHTCAVDPGVTHKCI